MSPEFFTEHARLDVSPLTPTTVLPGLSTREQTKPKSSCRNQEFSETEIRFWFRSGTILGFLVSVSVPGFKIFELPGYAGSSALNSWFNQELPG